MVRMNLPKDLKAGKQKPKVAVLLYGYLRTFETCAPSFMKHVADYHDADIFYFGPQETDKPATNHAASTDIFGHIKINPKNDAELVKETSDIERLRQVYGARLKGYATHTETTTRFQNDAAAIDPNEWLYSLDPSRFLSMGYNMSGSYQVMAEYANQTGTHYDVVILTRPDLCFFQPMALNIKAGQVHIPNGTGFSPSHGWILEGTAPALFYKNIERGEVIATGNGFNDQIIALPGQAAPMFGQIYGSMKSAIKLRVPLTPETMLYYHFVTQGNLKIVKNMTWLYEIVRFGQPLITNITDIYMLEEIDRHHTKVRENARKTPFKTFLRRAKRTMRFVMRKVLH